MGRPNGRPAGTRETDVVHTLVRLADTLVAGFDELELLRDLAASSVRILDGETAGISLGTGGLLGFVMGTSESAEIIELYQAERQQGPCIDAFRTGAIVSSADIAADRARWPRWAPHALALGFRSADAFPMRLRETTIGALNVYATRARRLDAPDLDVGLALAAMATIGIVHERASAEQDLVHAQLQGALDSRVIVEQAKGVLSQRLGLEPDDAFERLREHSRARHQKIAVTAHQVVHDHLVL